MRVGDRPPLLARLRVGTKLMLLALLPVGLLVACRWWRPSMRGARPTTCATSRQRRRSRSRPVIWPVRCRTSAPPRCSRGCDQARRPTRPSARRSAGPTPRCGGPPTARPRPPLPSMSPGVWRRSDGSCRRRGSRPPPGRSATPRSPDSYGLIVRDVLDLVRDLDSGRRRPTASVRTPRTRTSRSWRRSSRQSENAWMSRPYCRVGATEPPGGRAAGRRWRPPGSTTSARMPAAG